MFVSGVTWPRNSTDCSDRLCDAHRSESLVLALVVHITVHFEIGLAIGSISGGALSRQAHVCVALHQTFSIRLAIHRKDITDKTSSQFRCYWEQLCLVVIDHVLHAVVEDFEIRLIGQLQEC